jgi:mRNA interferase RelE/StbE
VIYAIVFARSAEKELERLDSVVARRILKKIKALAQDPRPAGCKKISGERNTWRIRIGDYRVVYDILDHKIVVEVLRVRHRREVYL